MLLHADCLAYELGSAGMTKKLKSPALRVFSNKQFTL